MRKKTNPDKQLAYMAFLNSENNFSHPSYDKEMALYERIKSGDTQWVKTHIAKLTSPTLGHLSDDRLRNVKYLFVAATTLSTRFALEGGLDSETAYNASDFYIQSMDTCTTIDEVETLHMEMMLYFAEHVDRRNRGKIYSKPILQCLDYIHGHLNQPLSLSALADQVRLYPTYLSELFKKETGSSISSYIRKKRIEAAENMLLYSDYSFTQISAYLAFSSQSYFIRIFKEETGYTPKAFRDRFFRNTFNRQHPEL